MKKYIEQIFNEGIGNFLYRPTEKRINMIKNKKIKKLFLKAYRIIYLLIVIVLFFVILYLKLK